MLAFLKSIVDSLLFLVSHLIEMLSFIPKLIGLLTESLSFIATGVAFAPVFLVPILSLILAVAVIMWLVNLL